jgi:hypothetical protein
MHETDRPVDGGSDDRRLASVLWRAPSPLRDRIRKTAAGLKVSQNSYLTTTAILGELVIARSPEGIPDNVRTLFEHMNATVKSGQRLVMEACHESDWATLREVLDVLSDARLVTQIQERRSKAAGQVVMYAFSFTREGLAVWGMVGPFLVALIEAFQQVTAPLLPASTVPA